MIKCRTVRPLSLVRQAGRECIIKSVNQKENKEMTLVLRLVKAGFLVVTFLMAIPFTGTAAEPRGAMIGQRAVGVATVEAIDRQTREITLKGDGGTATVTAGPEVRNFDRIKKGDVVVFEYFEGLALAVVPAVKGVPARGEALVTTRTERGEKPGVAVAEIVSVEGRVKHIDRKNRFVTLEGPRRTVTLKVAEQVDLKNISVGDAVLARYSRVYAVTVQPPADVDAEVLIQSKSVAFVVGYDWGEGTLNMRDGSRHKLKVKGLSVIDVGITKIEASGYVYNLEDLNDFAGTYSRAEAGITFIGGASTAILKNEKGVVIRLTSKEAGLKLTLAPGGMDIQIVE